MRDITLGQYVVTQSPMHRFHAGIKFLSLLFVIAFLFVAGNFWGLGVMTALVFGGMLLSGVKLRQYFRSLRGMLVLAIFTAVCNVFGGSGGTLLWSWGIFHITTGGIENAVFVLVRIMVLVFASAVLTFTTSPSRLTGGIEWLLHPLQLLKVPVHEFAMMMTIALRFIPILLQEADKIMCAQKARGADLESGNLFRRLRAMLPILVPLFVSAFRRALDLAVAMESRCYTGGKGRTKLHNQRIGLYDITVFAIVLLACAGVLVLRIVL